MKYCFFLAFYSNFFYLVTLKVGLKNIFYSKSFLFIWKNFLGIYPIIQKKAKTSPRHIINRNLMNYIDNIANYFGFSTRIYPSEFVREKRSVQ